MQITRLRRAALPIVLEFFAATAYADIDLRVEPWPREDPVDVLVRVSEDRDSVTGLGAGDFAATLDGQALHDITLSLPPGQDSSQRKSVVLVVSTSTGVDTFLREMAAGDYVSIVTFRDDREARFAPIDVQPFTRIDDTGTAILIDFIQNIYRRDPEDFRPAIPDLTSAIQRAIDQFEAPGVALPAGPKAIIVLQTDFLHVLDRQSDLVAVANSIGMPIFTIYWDGAGISRSARFESIAAATGGVSFPATEVSQLPEALTDIRKLLNDAYSLEIPSSVTVDCNPRLLEVTIRGETESASFTRCDTTPDDLSFPDKTDVPLDSPVASDPATVTGIESAVTISVHDGEYSVGCGPEFTSEAGWIQPEQQVCVRHTSGLFSFDTVSTLLVVGGVPAWFTSQTMTVPAPSPPPLPVGDGSGGGGSTGLLELLFAVGFLFSRRLYNSGKTWGRAALLTAALVAAPSRADVDLPLQLAPDQDPARHLSIVIVLADGRVVGSTIPAIAELPKGTLVAIVRAKYLPGDPTPNLAIHPFTRVDGDLGSHSLAGFLHRSVHDLAILRYGSHIPHLDFLGAGLDQQETPGIPLPRGPKAVVLVGNGRHVESSSGLTESALIARANALGMPVFTIGTEDFSDRPQVSAIMSAIARETGGKYLRGHTAQSLGKAYRRIWDLLRSATQTGGALTTTLIVGGVAASFHSTTRVTGP